MAFLIRYAIFAVFTLGVAATFSEGWRNYFALLLSGYFVVAGMIFLL